MKYPGSLAMLLTRMATTPAPIQFALGRIVATPGAIEVMRRLNPNGDDGAHAAYLLARHHSGDWGDLDDEDRAENDRAVRKGLRLMSTYGWGDNRLFVITEADRSATTILLPREV